MMSARLEDSAREEIEIPPRRLVGISMTRALVVLALLAGAARADELTPDAVARLRERVLPAEPERWETIPWETDLLAARARAAREGKPIFIWSMNGHPLGCT
jgi:hypothetical protein